MMCLMYPLLMWKQADKLQFEGNSFSLLQCRMIYNTHHTDHFQLLERSIYYVLSSFHLSNICIVLPNTAVCIYSKMTDRIIWNSQEQ